MIRTTSLEVTIANGASLSAAVNLNGWRVVGFEFPTLTSDSSSITFQSSTDNSTFREINEGDGTAYTVTTAATGATSVVLDSAATNPQFSVPYLKIRTGTSGAAQAQGAARTIKVIVAGES